MVLEGALVERGGSLSDPPRGGAAVCVLESLAAGLGAGHPEGFLATVLHHSASAQGFSCLEPHPPGSSEKASVLPPRGGGEVKSLLVGVPALQSVAPETQHSIQRTRPN